MSRERGNQSEIPANQPQPEGRRGRQKFVPLSEASTDKIIFNFPLPFSKDSIGVNVGGIKALLRIAGIERLTIVAKQDNEREQGIPAVGGIHNDGSVAITRAIAVPKVQEVSSEYTSPGQRRFVARAADWADVRIILNMQEMQKNISKENWQQGVVDPEAWSHHLTKAVAQEIFIQGTKHLLIDGKMDNNVLTGLSLFWNTVFDINTVNPGLGEYIGQYLVNFQLFPWLYFLFGKGKRNVEKPPRFSILGPYAPELDRVAILTGMTAPREFTNLAPLFKALPPAQS